MLDRIRRPSLKACLTAIVLVVLVPTLGVVGMALLNAGDSYREASTQQLLETAQVVAQSVDSEIDTTSKLLLGYGELVRHDREHNVAENVFQQLITGKLTLHKVGPGGLQQDGQNPQITALINEAAASGSSKLSNIVMDESGTGAPPQLVLAVPGRTEGEIVEVVTLTASPTEMIRSLMRKGPVTRSAVLAVTDGTGRIIGRSVDGERFVGRPVPDWKTLVALGTDSGSFRALTIEGNQIVFSFQKIAGTPGWAAVVGEPAPSFDNRWRQPILIMLLASGVTVLVALGLATILAQRVLRPISHLAARARTIANGNAPDAQAISVDIPPSFVSEFETLRTSLDEAENVLHRSLAESQTAEQTARRNADALQQAERLARIGSWTLDLKTGDLTCSDMLYELNGADPSGPTLKREDLERFLSPDSFRLMHDAMARCIATGEPYSLEVEHLHPVRGIFAAYVQGKAIRDDDGQVVKVTGTVQDISERKEERARLAALADNLPSGAIFRLESDAETGTRLAYVSAGIDRLIGITASVAVSRTDTLLDAVPPSDRRQLLAALARSRRNGGVLDHEFRIEDRKGGTLWMHVRAAQRSVSGGRRVWDGIARDITIERSAAMALQTAKEAAEAAEHAKSDFLATMSHEIRTPMNSVIGMARLALQTDLDAKQRNYLEKINASAAVLLGIINDILDFSKIEAGGLVLEETTFKLDSMLDSVSALTALRADEKNLELTFAVDPATPAMLKGDPLRVGQVLTNLVSNAVKFTEKGDILVSVKPKGQNYLHFSVRDSGIGLSAEQIAGLFRPFSQASSDTSRRFGGTGLGLAICKRLVELMNGEIWVDSEPGTGSTFHFTAKIEAVADDSATSNAARLSKHLHGRRALIVDDSASARSTLAEMAQSFGMLTTTAETGEAALTLLRDQANRGTPFDIVLLDWRMPGIDGVETARRIKADATLTDMPAVLMVTAYGHEIVLKAVEEIGLRGILHKPVTQSIMFNTVLGILSMSVQNEALLDPVSRADIDVTKALAGRRVLVVDDNALNREVATDFLELVGVTVVTAVDGIGAIEAMEREQFDAVLMDMHMPRMNGLEAVREIRKRPEWADLPVIALTAQARVEDHRASREAGMTAHLTKPIDDALLYRTLIDVLGLVPSATAESTKTPKPSGNLFDLEVASRRLGGNPQRVERAVSGFLREFGNAPEQFDALANSRSLGDIADLAHQIKGSVGYLGADALGDAADTIERAARDNDAGTVSQQAPIFRDLLASCLSGLEAMLSKMKAAESGATTPAMAAQDALDLLEQVQPLIQAGDFAAKEILERLGAGLSGTPQQSLVVEIEELYEELELTDAVEKLDGLREQLRSMSGRRA